MCLFFMIQPLPNASVTREPSARQHAVVLDAAAERFLVWLRTIGPSCAARLYPELHDLWPAALTRMLHPGFHRSPQERTQLSVFMKTPHQ